LTFRDSTPFGIGYRSFIKIVSSVSSTASHKAHWFASKNSFNQSSWQGRLRNSHPRLTVALQSSHHCCEGLSSAHSPQRTQIACECRKLNEPWKLLVLQRAMILFIEDDLRAARSWTYDAAFDAFTLEWGSSSSRTRERNDALVLHNAMRLDDDDFLGQVTIAEFGNLVDLSENDSSVFEKRSDCSTAKAMRELDKLYLASCR
jgi:hypothetical protein